MSMAAPMAMGGQQNDEVITLNVGGQYFMTKRSTLCQIEGSMLQSMFSGRWEEGHIRDETGRVFLDWDPKVFEILLRYLRSRQLCSTGRLHAPLTLPIELVGHWASLIRYLGVADAIYEPEVSVPLAFGNAGSGFKAGAPGYRSTKDVVKKTTTYVCRPPLQQTTTWRFRVSEQSSGAGLSNIGFGVSTRMLDMLATTHTSAPGIYERAGGAPFRVNEVPCEASLAAFEAGDVVVMRLDMQGRQLQFWHDRTSRYDAIKLPSGVEIYFAFARLSSAAQSVAIELQPATGHDVLRFMVLSRAAPGAVFVETS